MCLLQIMVRHCPAIITRWVQACILVMQNVEVRLMVTSEPIEATLRKGIFATLVLATDAGVAHLHKQSCSLLGHDFDRAHEPELEVDVLQVHSRTLRGAEVVQMVLQATGDEDSVGIHLHCPIVIPM